MLIILFSFDIKDAEITVFEVVKQSNGGIGIFEPSKGIHNVLYLSYISLPKCLYTSIYFSKFWVDALQISRFSVYMMHIVECQEKYNVNFSFLQQIIDVMC